MPTMDRGQPHRPRHFNLPLQVIFAGGMNRRLLSANFPSAFFSASLKLPKHDDTGVGRTVSTFKANVQIIA